MAKFSSSEKANRSQMATEEPGHQWISYFFPIRVEVSNEDFTICPYTPNILPTVPWHGLIVVLLLRISTL